MIGFPGQLSQQGHGMPAVSFQVRPFYFQLFLKVKTQVYGLLRVNEP